MTGLRKLSRSVYDATKRSESRHESYGHQFEEMARIHDHLSDNGLQFAHSLSKMHDDLAELASNIDRGRKHWKQVGLSAEKKVHDAELLMEKVSMSVVWWILSLLTKDRPKLSTTTWPKSTTESRPVIVELASPSA